MKKNILLGVIFLSAGIPLASADWKISEISFYPPQNEPPWIELENRSGLPAHLEGIRIKGDRAEWRFTGANTEIPAKSLVLVRFDGQGDGKTLAEENSLRVIHAPKRILFGDPKKGYCALYERQDVMSEPGIVIEDVPGNFFTKEQQQKLRETAKPKVIETKEKMVDFVAWGDEPGEIADEASGMNLWSGRGSFIATDPAPERQMSGPRDPEQSVDHPGKTLAVVAGGVWTILRDTDASPGRPNVLPLYPPSTISPSGLMLDSPSVLWWTGGKGHAQIATDELFTDIIRDFKDDSQAPVTPPLETGIYWWRVRRIGESGKVSAWSPAVNFKIGYPHQDPSRSPKS